MRSESKLRKQGLAIGSFAGCFDGLSGPVEHHLLIQHHTDITLVECCASYLAIIAPFVVPGTALGLLLNGSLPGETAVRAPSVP